MLKEEQERNSLVNCRSVRSRRDCLQSSRSINFKVVNRNYSLMLNCELESTVPGVQENSRVKE
jgi:hypothetical protein